MLSVVVPTYRRLPDLENCLASIRKNSKGKCEIVVLSPEIDDELQGLCMRYTAAVRQDGSRVQGRRLMSLWGIINSGIEIASHPFVCWLNDDCVVNDSWDSIALSYFDDTVGMVVLRTKGINGSPSYEVRGGFFGIPVANYAILRKSSGVRFDENFSWFYGDADISLQVAMKTGLRVVSTEEGLVVHAHRVDATRRENETDSRASRDLALFDRKWRFTRREGDRVIRMSTLETALAFCRYVAREISHFLRQIVHAS